jgi:DNA-binding response OmpR family regulator
MGSMINGTTECSISPLAFGIAIDEARQTVRVGEVSVKLSPKEFGLLALLSSEPGVVFRREQIISKVWSSRWKADGRTLEVHVASLRAKLGVPEAIETVRSIGYRLRVE